MLVSELDDIPSPARDVITEQGVEEVVEWEFDDEERDGLDEAAEKLGTQFEKLS